MPKRYVQSTFTPIRIVHKVKELFSISKKKIEKYAIPFSNGIFQTSLGAAFMATQLKNHFKTSTDWKVPLHLALDHHSMPSVLTSTLSGEKRKYALCPISSAKVFPGSSPSPKVKTCSEKNLHPLGRIFSRNLGTAKPDLFMPLKRNIAYSGSLNE